MIYYVYYKRVNSSPCSIRVNRATADRAIEHVEKHWLAGEADAEILYALPASEVCPDCEHPLSYHGGHGCTFKFLGVLGGDVVESLCQCQRKGEREG